MARIATLVQLETRQKLALQRRARSRGVSMAELIRNAVNRELGQPEVSEAELKELDHASRVAEKTIKQMSAQLDAMNNEMESTIARINKLRKAAGHEPY